MPKSGQFVAPQLAGSSILLPTCLSLSESYSTQTHVFDAPAPSSSSSLHEVTNIAVAARSTAKVKNVFFIVLYFLLIIL